MTPPSPIDMLVVMSTPAAGLWGYAEANKTVVGIVVALVVAAAVAYVARGLWRR